MKRIIAALALAACTHEAPKVAGPPYAGTLAVNALASVDYDAPAAEMYVQSLHLTDGVGTIAFEGQSWPAAVYEVIPFAPYALATIVATTDDGLVVTYAYCMNGTLVSLYLESLMVPDMNQAATGTCALGAAGTIDAAFTMPMALDYAPYADIADVDGDALTIHGGAGSVTIDGTAYDVGVFTTVDCSACGGAGWHELHATIRKDTLLAFAIFYLQADQPGMVGLDYGFRFDEPSLWPANQLLAASWTMKP